MNARTSFSLFTMWLGYVRAFTTVRRAVHPAPSSRLYSSDSDPQSARVLFLGTPDVAATSLRRIVEDSQKSSLYNVVGVVTQPPKRRKRKGKEIPSPVGYAAEELDIPVLCPEKVRDVVIVVL